MSIWPIYLAINEIPIEERFHIDNIIIAGIAVCEGKPSMDVFLKRIKIKVVGVRY